MAQVKIETLRERFVDAAATGNLKAMEAYLKRIESDPKRTATLHFAFNMAVMKHQKEAVAKILDYTDAAGFDKKTLKRSAKKMNGSKGKALLKSLHEERNPRKKWHDRVSLPKLKKPF